MAEPFALRLLRRADRYAGYNPLTSRLRWSNLYGKVTCILYHRIAEHGEQAYLEQASVPCTPPASFRRHLEYLRDAGAEFFTFRDLAQGRVPGPRTPGFVITFDDGFRDNFTTALPILKEYKIPAVFLIITERVGRDALAWEHQLYVQAADAVAQQRLVNLAREQLEKDIGEHNLLWAWRSLAVPEVCDRALAEVARACPHLPSGDPQALYPSWEEIRLAQDAGCEIASHTVSHRMRHLFLADAYLNELRQSRATLEDKLQAAVTSFSYPFNRYFFQDDELGREANYGQMATVDFGRWRPKDSLFWIPRLTVHGGHDRMTSFRQLILSDRAPG